MMQRYRGGLRPRSARGPWLCPTPLSHRCFSPVSPPNFAHFPPFFARSLRLGARKPGNAKGRRKNGRKRAQNGRETVGWVGVGIPRRRSRAPTAAPGCSPRRRCSPAQSRAPGRGRSCCTGWARRAPSPTGLFAATVGRQSRQQSQPKPTVAALTNL